ncbi:lytic transglycosylase domain-containing protein [Thermaurantiacus tibetensis]|uniref:lytic transglycosylase domain-containing protein n=1 Tax=Thermaurantiacus tibetensis TaxID=2759035 RepID=UPI00188E4A14|nr:lytic transglycosylase domain-containing protein [Thermaurantiacus tibetensis]
MRLPVVSAVLAAALALGAPAAAQGSEEAWLAAAFQRNDMGAAAPPAGAPTPLAQALATWDWLRRARSPATRLPLPETAAWLAANPGFPNHADIRRRAEVQAADPALTSDSEARAFFAAVQPETAAGRARFALLTLEPERQVVARQQARAAWVSTGVPEPLERALLDRFGPFLTAADHAARADALLWAGQTTAAARMLPLLPEDERALAAARLALRTNAPDAEARAASVPAKFREHAGLVHDRSLWLERNRRLADAEALLAGARVTPESITAPRTWLQRRLALGRAAWRRGDARLAERLLASHGMTIGSESLALPLGVRVDLSDTEWLAGFLALRTNGRPEEAARHFARFGQLVQTPISRARGDYWLGRAEQARGNSAAATAAFERAAQHFDSFYGQLAAEALGRTPVLPRVAPAPVPAEIRAAVEALPLARALVLLGRMGDGERQSPFVRALAAAVSTPAERRAAAELGLRLDRPDLAVWLWREARPGGDLSLLDLAYPRLPASVPADRYIYAHAIARQESSFDRFALSSAGARGLMQLMPATAADVAKRLGLPFEARRLLTDPAYNILLGSDYLGLRRDNLGNWMLAAAAYNAGIGNARRFIAQNGDPRQMGTEAVIDWIEAIPIAETRSYVQRVTENAVVYSLLEPGRPDARPRASAWLR